MEWYLRAWRKYADFSGRARRKEYLAFVLINTLIALIIGAFVIFGMTAGATSNSGGLTTGSFSSNLISWVWSIVIFLPTLAVTVRRLHDTNHNGWLFLICLVPLVGPILIIVWLLSDSNPGENDYGPDPKTEEEYETYNI